MDIYYSLDKRTSSPGKFHISISTKKFNFARVSHSNEIYFPAATGIYCGPINGTRRFPATCSHD